MMKLGRAVRFNEDAHLEMSSSYSRSGQGSKIPRKCCLIADSKESSKKFLVILTHRCLKVVVTLMVILPSPAGLGGPVDGVFSVLDPLLKPMWIKN